MQKSEKTDRQKLRYIMLRDSWWQIVKTFHISIPLQHQRNRRELRKTIYLQVSLSFQVSSDLLDRQHNNATFAGMLSEQKQSYLRKAHILMLLQKSRMVESNKKDNYNCLLKILAC